MGNSLNTYKLPEQVDFSKHIPDDQLSKFKPNSAKLIRWYREVYDTDPVLLQKVNNIYLSLQDKYKNEAEKGAEIQQKLMELKKLCDQRKGEEGGSSEKPFQRIDPEKVSLNDINIELDDRVIFILATFVIRTISVAFLQWAIETDFINSLESAFVFFGGMYLLIFSIIVVFVNNQSGSNSSVPNILYYFYYKSFGIGRLLVHIGFLLILMMVPFIIQSKGQNTSESKYTTRSYEEKQEMLRLVSQFSTVIWLSLSIVALLY
jgi:hypothetical protein